MKKIIIQPATLRPDIGFLVYDDSYKWVSRRFKINPDKFKSNACNWDKSLETEIDIKVLLWLKLQQIFDIRQVIFVCRILLMINSI